MSEIFTNLRVNKDDRLRGMINLFNPELRNACENSDITTQGYLESTAGDYDPVRPRVMTALTESFIKADLNTLKAAQELETDATRKMLYPHKPDLIMGYRGEKIAFYLMSTVNAMRDDGKPHGDLYN